jgi:tRNA dimethylallyltransferase
MEHSRIPVIAGPTAGGKSGLAIEVALEFERRGLGRGEIVSCDSVQVYRGLDIGSGKPPPAERRGVAHHLIDVAEPGEPFTVRRWLDLALAALADIASRGRPVIVAGGTHLYVKSLLGGLIEGPGADPALRRSLSSLTREERRAELERIDPAAAARIHPADDRRTIRALEVHRLTGRPISSRQVQWKAGDGTSGSGATGRFLLVILDWPTHAINRRINARVAGMIAAGLVEEARALMDSGRLVGEPARALGYRQVASHLRGECSLADAVEAVKIQTRRYAKNQRTWLRRMRTEYDSLVLTGGEVPLVASAQCVVDACLALAQDGAGRTRGSSGRLEPGGANRRECPRPAP